MAAAMPTGAPSSSREMEPPPGFASTQMHMPMLCGMPRLDAPNCAPRVTPPPWISRPRARRQPTAPSAPHFSTAAPAPYQTTNAPALPPPPPGFGVRPPRGHAGVSARAPPPRTGPLSLEPIVSTLLLILV
jgi:hypothetical protein